MRRSHHIRNVSSFKSCRKHVDTLSALAMEEMEAGSSRKASDNFIGPTTRTSSLCEFGSAYNTHGKNLDEP